MIELLTQERPLDPNCFYVYAWWDGAVPFYVGKGRGCRDAKTKSYNPHFMRKLAKMEREGRKPNITRICDQVDDEFAFLVEMEAIAKWGRYVNGGTLTNLTDGGEGLAGHKHTADTKRKQHLAHLGRRKPPEQRLVHRRIRLLPADWAKIDARGLEWLRALIRRKG